MEADARVWFSVVRAKEGEDGGEFAMVVEGEVGDWRGEVADCFRPVF